MDLGRESHRCFGLFQEAESRLLRGSIGLFPIAVHAARNDVLPVLSSTTSNRDYVIVSQSVGKQLALAILAAVLIPDEQIVTGEFDLCMIPSDLNIMKKSDHGR